MLKIIQGLHHFQKNVFGTERELFENLAHGQSPNTMFITCSDSRVATNLITNTKPGELFVLRNAGNLVPPYSTAGGSEVATIELAVRELNVTDIVICGHSDCGAIKCMLNPESLGKMPAMAQWLKYAEATKWIIEENYSHLTGDALLSAAVEENVLVQMENLQTHPAVAARLVKGELRLHAWVYKIETGEVYAYHPEKERFVLLEEGADSEETEYSRPKNNRGDS